MSLSRINVYACLVCGKYFQGRGHNTHAYTHSVSDEQHRVFLNLATKKFYCLPDNYEIIDPSLSDIIYVLDPTYPLELINKLETSGKGEFNIWKLVDFSISKRLCQISFLNFELLF